MVNDLRDADLGHGFAVDKIGALLFGRQIVQAELDLVAVGVVVKERRGQAVIELRLRLDPEVPQAFADPDETAVVADAVADVIDPVRRRRPLDRIRHREDHHPMMLVIKRHERQKIVLMPNLRSHHLLIPPQHRLIVPRLIPTCDLYPGPLVMILKSYSRSRKPSTVACHQS